MTRGWAALALALIAGIVAVVVQPWSSSPEESGEQEPPDDASGTSEPEGATLASLQEGGAAGRVGLETAASELPDRVLALELARGELHVGVTWNELADLPGGDWLLVAEWDRDDAARMATFVPGGGGGRSWTLPALTRTSALTVRRAGATPGAGPAGVLVARGHASNDGSEATSRLPVDLPGCLASGELLALVSGASTDTRARTDLDLATRAVEPVGLLWGAEPATWVPLVRYEAAWRDGAAQFGRLPCPAAWTLEILEGGPERDPAGGPHPALAARAERLGSARTECGTTGYLEFAAAEAASIVGVLRTAGGAQRRGVRVRLYERAFTDEAVARLANRGLHGRGSTETDERGAFAFHGLAAGEWQVEATVVEEGDRAAVDFYARVIRVTDAAVHDLGDLLPLGDDVVLVEPRLVDDGGQPLGPWAEVVGNDGPWVFSLFGGDGPTDDAPLLWTRFRAGVDRDLALRLPLGSYELELLLDELDGTTRRRILLDGSEGSTRIRFTAEPSARLVLPILADPLDAVQLYVRAAARETVYEPVAFDARLGRVVRGGPFTIGDEHEALEVRLPRSADRLWVRPAAGHRGAGDLRGTSLVVVDAEHGGAIESVLTETPTRRGRLVQVEEGLHVPARVQLAFALDGVALGLDADLTVDVGPTGEVVVEDVPAALTVRTRSARHRVEWDVP